MKKIISLSLILISLFAIAACDGGKQVKTAKVWDKVIMKSYNELIAADANYKLEKHQKISREEKVSYENSQADIIIGNKAQSNAELKYGKGLTLIAMAYSEIKDDMMYTWQTEDGGETFDKKGFHINLNDVGSSNIGFKAAGVVTMGAYLTQGGLFLNMFANLFDYFEYQDGKYFAKQEKLKEISELYSSKIVDATGSSVSPGAFSSCSISISGGLVIGTEMLYVSEDGEIVETSYIVTYGKQIIEWHSMTYGESIAES